MMTELILFIQRQSNSKHEVYLNVYCLWLKVVCTMVQCTIEELYSAGI